MSKPFSPSRRDFLKWASGAAASSFLALPARYSFAQTRAPLRFLTLIDTYGIPLNHRQSMWVSSSAGDYALNEAHLGTILQPLSAYIDNMLVVSNISLQSQAQSRDSRTHHYLTTHTLTGSSALAETRNAEASFALKHASVDMRIGRYLHTEYGLAAPRIYDHLFFSDYEHRNAVTFCFNQDGIQKRSIAGALNVRNALFGENISGDAGVATVTNKARLDALRLVKERVTALSSSLQNATQDELFAAYQASVDSVAQELALKSENVVTMPAELASGITNPGRSSADAAPNMFKNIYHAFAFDMVSSITYAFGGEKINQNRYGFLYDEAQHGDAEVKSLIAKNFHAPSHRTDDVAAKTHEIVRISQSTELATLLDRMSTTIDSDGSTLLDNTVVFFTSQMSNNVHSTGNFPILLIAGKNTNLQGGFHYDCEDSTNNDLLTTIAQGLTLPDDHFGGHNRAGEYLTALNNGPITKMLKT